MDTKKSPIINDLNKTSKLRLVGDNEAFMRRKQAVDKLIASLEKMTRYLESKKMEPSTLSLSSMMLKTYH